jgi:Phage derived protein Gp49-like (DUF891)
MGSEYTFYDYLDRKYSLRAWLKGQPAAVRALFTKRLFYLEATPPGLWTRPYVDTLDGGCAGLFEVRVRVGKVHYRILACHGDRTPTLLHGFTKPHKRVNQAECNRALARKVMVDARPDNFREMHRYD